MPVKICERLSEMMKTDVWCEDGQSKEETSKHELMRRCECEGLRTATHQYFSICSICSF